MAPLTGELPLGRFPLPSQKAAVTPRLDDVVLRALEKDPQKRCQRAADLAADVEVILAGSPAAVAAPSRSDTPPIAESAARPPATQAVEARREALEQAAGREVSGPATGLLITGVLSILQGVVFVVVLVDIGLRWLTLLGVPFGVFMALAARRMRRLEAPEFALVGSILALVPVGPAWAVGLPTGIWALLVLRKPDVQAAFAVPKPAGAAIPWPRWLPRSSTIWAITLCVLGLVTTVLPWVTQPGRDQDASPGYALPGFLTWPGLAAALLFLWLGSSLLGAQRTWPDAVRRRALFLCSCLTVLLAIAGLGMLLFLFR